ncbi:MAG: DUF2309 domain-containing protein [Leptospiraceae bacterium]|nr:DUF2309 domain-containing protein [Leptospiraceae bacterium]
MNIDLKSKTEKDLRELRSFLDSSSRKIAPVWPLESFVAVNPYLNFIDKPFEEVASLLDKVDGAKMTLPVSFYLQALESGRIKEEDLQYALDKSVAPVADDVPSLLALLKRDSASPQGPSVPTVADTAGASGQNWKEFLDQRFSSWAAAYFDESQAIWKSATSEEGLFASWKFEAGVDRTPESMGLKGFRSYVENLPSNPLEAAAAALDQLRIPDEGMDLYIHRLLIRVGGWTAYTARIVWDSELYGGSSDALIEVLTIRLCQEAALLHCLDASGLPAQWEKEKGRLSHLSQFSGPEGALARMLVLQAALDRAEQRRLIEMLNQNSSRPAQSEARSSHGTHEKGGASEPALDAQAVFCIDVRSEVFRRNLEAVSPSVQTMGFAGFFAFPLEFVPLGHEKGGAHCPVLLTPAAHIHEGYNDPSLEKAARNSRSLKHHVKKAWWSFKMGAISCFSFVGPIGLAYLPKMIGDALGLSRPVPHPDVESLNRNQAGAKKPILAAGDVDGTAMGLTLEQRLNLAKGALQAMSLTEGFAPMVLITGHGSTTVNNPHATGLDCGACGGRTGEANARVAAEVLNDPAVRKGLAGDGIQIPEDTFFLACQHDTTTDEVTFFNEAEAPAGHSERIKRLKQWLAEAGALSRAERANRIARNGVPLAGSSNVQSLVLQRSKDWSQVRPEWGLAGCSAFIVGPRANTAGLDLQGRSFLHSYEWKQDQGFGVLELIMTAPMVVASWISLQYYGSTVENRLFGSGNKTLHNVVGGVGVLEGNGGDLRVGLPWQSVHDGESYQHEPVRLNVFIEAPMDAMNNIIKKHTMVRNLLDNGWLQLLATTDGKVSHRYAGSMKWEAVN